MNSEPSRSGVRWTTGGALTVLVIAVLGIVVYSFAAPVLGALAGGLAGVLVFLACLLVAGLFYQTLADNRDRKCYPPPGKLVDVGGFRLHFQVLGDLRGGPTVILENAGGGVSSLWGWVAPEVARFVRVALYDRPGMGWSEASPRPVDAEGAVALLHAALDRLDLNPPYVLVGHSLGGLIARIFARQYPGQAAGLVLVDPRPNRLEDLFPVDLAQRSIRARRLTSLVTRLGLLRLSGINARSFAGLPDEQLAETVAFHSSIRYLQGLESEVRIGSSAESAIQAAPGNLGDLPLIVLSSGQADITFPGEARTRLTQAQKEFAGLSTRGEHRIVEGADHYSILLRQENAQAVVAAIREVVEAARSAPIA